MITEVYTSVKSFVLGLGILSYFILHFRCHDEDTQPLFHWLYHHPLSYCFGCYFIVNVVIVLMFRGTQWQVAVRGCFLGATCSCGVIVSVTYYGSYEPFGWYIVILSSFHFLEYLATAITNPTTLTLDSYLLNHSVAYWIAALASWIEFFVEQWLYPDMKRLWYISLIGIVTCVGGEVVRKLAMFTATTNFNHVVQVKRQEGHLLITNGIYRFFRHPSYVGWFWWSIGTQIILLNPVCIVAYAAASWIFFQNRIYFEEMTLIKFFGSQYLTYQKRVGTGLPFIKGYIIPVTHRES